MIWLGWLQIGVFAASVTVAIKPLGGYIARVVNGHDSVPRRFAAIEGTLEILEGRFDGTPIREGYLIVDSGVLAGAGAQSYKLT